MAVCNHKETGYLSITASHQPQNLPCVRKGHYRLAQNGRWHTAHKTSVCSKRNGSLANSYCLGLHGCRNFHTPSIPPNLRPQRHPAPPLRLAAPLDPPALPARLPRFRPGVQSCLEAQLARLRPLIRAAPVARWARALPLVPVLPPALRVRSVIPSALRVRSVIPPALAGREDQLGRLPLPQ